MGTQSRLVVCAAVALLRGVSEGFAVSSPGVRAATRVAATIERPSVEAVDEEYSPTVGEHAPLTKNNQGETWLPQMARPRRNRKSAGLRAMVRETSITAANLMQPIFIHDEETTVGIGSMPGQMRHSLGSMLEEVRTGLAAGVRSFVLFPKVSDGLKSNYGEEAYNPTGLVPRAVALIKKECPDAVVVTDIALDPYSDQGHDGVVHEGKILNDVTVEQLCKQAVCHARAGADIVAPSDMMDGRVGALRMALDAEGFTDVSILAYSAKYASAFYASLERPVRAPTPRAGPLPRRPRLASGLRRQEDLPAGSRQLARGHP